MIQLSLWTCCLCHQEVGDKEVRRSTAPRTLGAPTISALGKRAEHERLR